MNDEEGKHLPVEYSCLQFSRRRKSNLIIIQMDESVRVCMYLVSTSTI